MPLVFVHGVATRWGDDPAGGRALRQQDALFRSLVLKQPAGVIHNAYWGDLGAKPSMQWASLPGGDQPRAEVFATRAPAGDSHFLARLALDDMGEAIDVLFGTLFERYLATGEDVPQTLLAAAEVAAEFAGALDALREQQRDRRVPRAALPDWLVEELSDAEFAAHLEQELGLPTAPARTDDERERFAMRGILEGLAGAVKDAFGRVRQGASSLVLGAVRDDLHPAVGRFLGDVFVYLNQQRGTPEQPGAIPQRIAETLREANAARSASDPLIVVGHSFGGIILLDLLRSFQQSATPLVPGLHIDALVTVGSQVGVFQELGVLADGVTGGQKAAAPANVGAWLNVYDEVDVLSFLAAPLFDGVTDYRFSSRTGLLSAHSAYFLRPRFYQRLRARLVADGILPA